MKGSRTVTWLTALLVAVFLIGAAVTGVVAFFLEGSQNTTAIALFQKILQPLGTAIVAGLYLCRDYLPQKNGATSQTRVTAEAKSGSSAKSGDVVVNIQNLAPPQFASFSREDL